jgi:hypothetical protein
MKSKSGLLLRDHASFGGDVNLRGTKADGDLDMSSSSFRAVNADGLHVRGNLFMHDKASFEGDVVMTWAELVRSLIARR